MTKVAEYLLIILEFVLKIFGIKVKHRGVTHQLLSIVIFFILALLLSVYIGTFLAWFAFGALTHWFCDALTVTGVPILPFSQHNQPPQLFTHHEDNSSSIHRQQGLIRPMPQHLLAGKSQSFQSV